VDNESGFGSPEVDEPSLAASAFMAVSVFPDGSYYWHVRSRDGSGNWGAWSGTWSFTIAATGPGAPALLSPADGMSTNDDTPAFDWGDVRGAVEYELMIATDYGFMDTVVDSPELTVSRYTSSIRLNDGTYYWRVRCRDKFGRWSDWSITRGFITNISISNLVVYCPFDGNAIDESGHGNQGTVYGATLGSDRFGNFDKAYYFNGQSSYIVIPKSLTLEPDNFSVAIWMNTRSSRTDTYQTLVIKDDGWNDGFKIVIRSEVTDEHLDKILFTVSGPDYDNEGYANLHSATSVGEINAWYHVVATYQSGGLMKIFINGQLDAQMQGPASWDKGNSHDLVMGRHSNHGDTYYGGYFYGLLDELRMYDRALSDEEIQLLYASEKP